MKRAEAGLLCLSREDLPLCAPTVVAIGNFDGVHLGHQALLACLTQTAKQKDALPLVFTFKENPKVLYCGAKYLYGAQQKRRLFAEAGVKAVYEADFAQVQNMSCEAFVREFLIERLNCLSVAVGSNFRFGNGRRGDADTMCRLLREHGLEGTVVPPVCVDGKEVSSSAIRRALEAGDLQAVQTMLGRPYSVYLPVSRGKRLGHTIGFPTINQLPSTDRQLPKFGVYLSEAEFCGKTYRGLTNVGVKPTVSSEARPLYETHLLEYEGNEELYGVTVKLTLKRFLRKERCFSRIEDLQAQIQSDLASLQKSERTTL